MKLLNNVAQNCMTIEDFDCIDNQSRINERLTIILTTILLQKKKQEVVQQIGLTNQYMNNNPSYSNLD